MFTGIIEAVGTIRSLRDGVLTIDAPQMGEPWKIGESIAVNGACLTLVSFDDGLRFELSPETLNRTNLGMKEKFDKVNLERAMRADGRFGGHIVQGHVDAVGSVYSETDEGEFRRLRIACKPEFAGQFVEKGSIAVDGVSLTIVAPSDQPLPSFEVWLVPHTLENTTLKEKHFGDTLNLEFDILAKYVARLLQVREE